MTKKTSIKIAKNSNGSNTKGNTMTKKTTEQITVLDKYMTVLDWEIEHNTKALTEWTEKLQAELTTPQYGALYSFEWAGEAANVAARLDVARQIKNHLLESIKHTGHSLEGFEYALRVAYREVRRHASTSSSTSPWSNASANCKADAWERKIDELENRIPEARTELDADWARFSPDACPACGTDTFNPDCDECRDAMGQEQMRTADEKMGPGFAS